MIKGGQRLVALGGGTGLSTLLAGLKQLVGKTDDRVWIDSLSAIVTVSDDGGSSGRLRDELADASSRRHSKLHCRAVGRFEFVVASVSDIGFAAMAS